MVNEVLKGLLSALILACVVAMGAITGLAFAAAVHSGCGQ